MKLYELAKDWIALTQAESDEELDGALTKVSKLGIDIHTKIENIVKVIRNIEAERDAAKEESKRLSARASSFDGEAKRLRAYLTHLMGEMGVKKSKGSLATVSYREGVPRVEVEDAKKVPEKFIEEEVVRKINKRAIADQIKTTGEIPEGIDWVFGDPTVSIR